MNVNEWIIAQTPPVGVVSVTYHSANQSSQSNFLKVWVNYGLASHFHCTWCHTVFSDRISLFLDSVMVCWPTGGGAEVWPWCAMVTGRAAQCEVHKRQTAGSCHQDDQWCCQVGREGRERRGGKKEGWREGGGKELEGERREGENRKGGIWGGGSKLNLML